jgi:hypothetical protein
MSGEARSWIQSFGVIDGGLELMKYAWPSLDHKFSVRQNNTTLMSDDGTTKVILGHHRYPKDLLCKHPVDLLTVEQGHCKSPHLLNTNVRLGRILSIRVPSNAGPRVSSKLVLPVHRCGDKGPSVKPILRYGRRWASIPDAVSSMQLKLEERSIKRG